jgi:excisionase family DNA binding protein
LPLHPAQIATLAARWGIDPARRSFNDDDPELAQLLGDPSLITIRRKIQSKELPAVKVGRNWVVLVADLVEYLAARHTDLELPPIPPPAPKAAGGRPPKRQLQPRMTDEDGGRAS